MKNMGINDIKDNNTITGDAVRKHIFTLADEKYREFHSALVPGEDSIIGVRIPVLRKYAKELYSSWKGTGGELITLIGDEYYEEIMLQGMITGMQKVPADVSQEELFSMIKGFVPKISNWAVCDTFCAGLKQVKKCREQTYGFLRSYLNSDKEYEIRFGLVMLLDYYTDEEHLRDIFDICEDIRGMCRKFYYVSMAAAWLLSICFVRFYDETRAFMSDCSLDDLTYNRALQKARESLRITAEQKKELQTMKRKIQADNTSKNT